MFRATVADFQAADPEQNVFGDIGGVVGDAFQVTGGEDVVEIGSGEGGIGGHASEQGFENLVAILVNDIVAPESLLARARELAALLMENSPASLRATKKLLTEHARAELDKQIEAAVRENAAVRTTADFREGIASFLEKRKPVWSGK